MSASEPNVPYQSRWYLCEIEERDLDVEEPGWSRIPPERVARVRASFENRPTVKRIWNLWGPQIPLYLQTPGMIVSVMG